ncbi:MAG TPA: mannosyltransferase family protein [Candidatus Dormibacteraeota bacterium]|nr:mannosyltransferase family protein [Candidatus Dormibacteraeota bacterium]
MRSLSEAAGRPVRRYPIRTRLAESWQSAWQRPWSRLALLALLVKLVLVALTLITYGAGPDPLTALGRDWDRWDASHYLYLASHGYSASGDARNLIAFFPLYPALIGAVAAIGLPVRIAALLISNVAGVVAAILLYEIGRQDRGPNAAFRAAAFFTVFPTAYFLMVGYTEALFCALAFAAVLAARRQQWMLGGALAGLAAATRLTGLALLPFLVVELFAARQALRSAWHAIAPPLLIVAGFASYLATNALVLGNPFAFISVQREHWSHSLAAPWVGFASAIQSIGWRVPWEKLTVGAGEALGGITAYATATLSWLRLRPSDAVYATVVTVMVTFLPFWLSIPRYLLSLYPLFLLIGRIRSHWLYLAMVGASFLGLVTFGLAFGRGYWAF